MPASRPPGGGVVLAELSPVELDRVTLAAVEAAIGCDEQSVTRQRQVVEATAAAGQGTVPARELLAAMEHDLDLLRAWRLDLRFGLAGSDLP